jgi:hypothetical protein
MSRKFLSAIDVSRLESATSITARIGAADLLTVAPSAVAIGTHMTVLGDLMMGELPFPASITADGRAFFSGNVRMDTGVGVSLSSTGHPFTIGADAGVNTAFGQNTLQSRNNGAVGVLNLNPLGGAISCGGGVSVLQANNEVMRLTGNTLWDYIAFYNPTNVTRRGFIGTQNDLDTIIASDAGALLFRSGLGSTPAATLDASGNFMVGKTIATIANIGHTLTPTYNAVTSNVLNVPGFVVNKIAPAAAGGSDYLHFRQTNVTMGSVASNGANTATVYNTTSDYRLKDDRGFITDGITRVNQLLPRRVHWKNTPEEDVVDGFFAHEVAEVIPDAVTGEKDAVATKAQEEQDGNGLTEEGQIVPQQIDTKLLIPVMVAAIKELDTRLVALETLLPEKPGGKP